MSDSNIRTTPRIGDHVRVTFDAKVLDDSWRPGTVGVEPDEIPNELWDVQVSWLEVISDPEPEWAPGDAVRSAVGFVYLRTPHGTWIDELGAVVKDDKVKRPLTVLYARSQHDV